MTAVVLVGLSIEEVNQADLLHRRAAAEDATVAYLQHGEPSLVAELTRLAEAGASTIRLEPVSCGERSSARSWVRRVAGHWLRQSATRTSIMVGDSPVTGREAGLTSSAWEEVPGHSRHVLVCRGPRCSAQGADRTARAIDTALREMRLGGTGGSDDAVLVTQTGCLFPCNHAPVVVVHPDDAWYRPVDEPTARRIVIESISWGLPVREHRLRRRRPRPEGDTSPDS